MINGRGIYLFKIMHKIMCGIIVGRVNMKFIGGG